MKKQILLAAALALLLAGAGQPGGAPASPLPTTVPGLAERLAALNPQNPQAYFLLAEELAAEAGSDRPSRDLARSLFVLSFELYRARNQPGDGELARSATLGLASLTRIEPERRWLAAIGDQVAPPGDRAGSASARLPAAVPEVVAFHLATAMGLARSGEGRRAEQYLAREGVRELLAANQVTITGDPAAGQPVLKWIADWPACPTCKNRRVVTRANESELCPYCDGNPGPKLSDSELLKQFRAESLLLRGVYRSWSAQILADDGEPLRDPNPADLAVSFGVDPRGTLWRKGSWVAQ